MKVVRFWQVALVACCMALLGDAAAERQRVAEHDPLHGQRSMISQRVVSSGDWVTLRERFTPQAGGVDCAQPRSLWLAKGEEAVAFAVSPLVDSCWQDGDEQVLHIEFMVPDAPGGRYQIFWQLDSKEALALMKGVVLHVQDTPRFRLVSEGPSGNIILDPGFELGSFASNSSSPWRDYSTEYGSAICSVTDCGGLRGGAYSGDYWVWFGSAKKPECAYVKQAMVFPVNYSIKLDFYLRIADVAEAGYFKVFMDDRLLFVASHEDADLFADYKRVVIGLNAFADGREHTLSFEGYSVDVEGNLIDCEGVDQNTSVILEMTSFFLDETSIVAEAEAGSCSEENLLLSGAIYGSGEKRYTAGQRIDVEAATLLWGDGELHLSAPVIRFGEGFRALSGSHLVARAEPVTCAE